jgi:hypothetical protein
MMHDVPRVTPTEFANKVRPALASHGWNDHQLNQAEALFHESLAGKPTSDWAPGVDEHSLESTMQFLRAHPSATAIGPHHWDQFQEVMQKSIKNAI